MDGRWGTVCNKSQEGVAEAVCSQLGFLGQGNRCDDLRSHSAIKFLYSDATVVSSFGPGLVPINNCTVEHDGRLICHQITDASCDHSMDLGVVCGSYQQLYNELRDQVSNMQYTPSSSPGQVSGKNWHISLPSPSIFTFLLYLS